MIFLGLSKGCGWYFMPVQMVEVGCKEVSGGSFHDSFRGMLAWLMFCWTALELLDESFFW